MSSVVHGELLQSGEAWDATAAARVLFLVRFFVKERFYIGESESHSSSDRLARVATIEQSGWILNHPAKVPSIRNQTYSSARTCKTHSGVLHKQISQRKCVLDGFQLIAHLRSRRNSDWQKSCTSSRMMWWILLPLYPLQVIS